MSLLVALFLIIVILIRVADDKAKSAVYEREKQKEKIAIEAWEGRYVDKALERQLKAAINDTRNYDAVCDEVLPVLTQLKQYKFLNRNNFPTMRYYERVALDIMLAHRGKVSHDSTYWGYHACMSNNNLKQKEYDFEYAEMILKLLKAHNVSLTLYYCDMRYVWKGSHLDYSNSIMLKTSPYYKVYPFNRAAIFKENPIPPIK